MDERIQLEAARFFSDYPEAEILFRHLAEGIEKLGPVTIEVKKTQISFGTKRKFAWVWLPQTWVGNRPGNSITLTFALRQSVSHPRIAEWVEPYPGRFTHHVVLRQESDIDELVIGWLEQAYSESR